MEQHSVIYLLPFFYSVININKTPLFLTLPLFDKYFYLSHFYM